MARGRNRSIRSHIFAHAYISSSSMSAEQAEAYIETGSLEGISDEPPPEPYDPELVKRLTTGRQ